MPQWNCGCANCRAAREGRIPARTQSCVAVSGDGTDWYLINASPDLRAQIESLPALHPAAMNVRGSPIQGVLLTNADLDHVLGLFLLRESPQLRLILPAAVAAVLNKDLHLEKVLRPSCVIEQTLPSFTAPTPLLNAHGRPGPLQVRAIALAEERPPYSSVATMPGPQSVAYEITDEGTRGRVLVAPDVAVITPELREAMEAADAVLLDGTFWSDQELIELTGRKRTAAQMGHLPIRDGSLEVMRQLRARHKIYFHINNTNPILAHGSPERAAVENAGVTVGEDGMEFEL